MKNQWKWIFAAVGLMGIWSCSSTPTQKVDVESPEFKVKEAAPGGRESWLDHPMAYAEAKDLGVKDNFFYSAEARGADKRLTCEKAQANLTDDISKQIAIFVDTSIARASMESQVADASATTETGQVSEETQRISSQLSKTSLSNISVIRTYWEKRDYSEAGGARAIYHCWILGQIGKKEVKDLVQRANTLKLKNNPELKAKVEDKLQNIGNDYEKYQDRH